jgi:hypothetical protein
MVRKMHTAEDVVSKLLDVLIARGKSVVDAAQATEVTEVDLIEGAMSTAV